MPNPRPKQTQAFIEQQNKGYIEDWINEPLAKQVTGLRLPQSVHDTLHALVPEERVKYLRRIICEAVKRDLTPNS
ncbi:hypothetical protein NIES4071_48190 [Calothrix sp. NIES-4071]|nr:hypothetical protein NIES4071_48190 [Calothrix sp. NIES-4071]BAZ59131.1 hypothetical protein NIES4105_48130 [Calothrix sp. NIES-4105]